MYTYQRVDCKRMIVVLMFFLVAMSSSYAQTGFNKALNKDSLMQVVIKRIPEQMKKTWLKEYKKGSEEQKEFLLLMGSMPVSRKQALIANIDTNFQQINLLKTRFEQLVPKGYTVSLEITPANIIALSEESVDLAIDHNGSYKKEWGMKFNSDKLQGMMQQLGWTIDTLQEIKHLLAAANCVSITNGNVTKIGFARSGMGMYSFRLHAANLTPDEINQNNNGCTLLFYKENIVLEYGGGAIGAQCFPD